MEKQLGSLPVIADFSRRLDIAGIVERACPMRDVGPISHRQVIEALIANRLTSPKAMVAVADWAHTWAVDEVYGIHPDTLNDDRLGRALDALAGQVDQVVGSIGAKAIDVFGIDVARCHWDMTSISLYGAYRDTEDDHPAPAFGHPKDRRSDLKQIQAGLAVTADGGIPVFHRVYDGNAAEISQVTDTMRALQTLAAPRSFLLVGDSKLISYPNVTAMHDAQVTFIAPLAASRVPDGLFAAGPGRGPAGRLWRGGRRAGGVPDRPGRGRGGVQREWRPGTAVGDGHAGAEPAGVLRRAGGQLRQAHAHAEHVRPDGPGPGPPQRAGRSERRDVDTGTGTGDATMSTLSVRHADGTVQSVGAYALSTAGGYPRGLTRAADRLRSLEERTDETGTPYKSPRVRLVLDPHDQSHSPVHPWPTGVEAPTTTTADLPTADLAAAAVVAGFPESGWPEPAQWPLYRLPDGSVCGVAWRYLAPNEDLAQ